MFIKSDFWINMPSLRSLLRLLFGFFLHVVHCLGSDLSKNAIYMVLVSDLSVKRARF